MGDEDSDEVDEVDYLVWEIYGFSDDEDLDGEISERVIMNGNWIEDDDVVLIVLSVGEFEMFLKVFGCKLRWKRVKLLILFCDFFFYELYFLYNKFGRLKILDNILELFLLLLYEEYFVIF